MPTDNNPQNPGQPTGTPAVDPMAPQPTMPVDQPQQVNPEPSAPAQTPGAPMPSEPVAEGGPVVPPTGVTPDGTQPQQ